MSATAVIALVDDDPSVRRALDRLLSSAGYGVRSFASGDELLESGFAFEARCLLIDVHLVGMSGFELLESLRVRGVDSSVVFMTAHDSEQTRLQAAEVGSHCYLRKPFEASALLDAVREAVTQGAR
jgi:FixJ family two-component response regulator